MDPNRNAQRHDRTTTAPQPRADLAAGAALVEDVPERRMLRNWLDSWAGLGHVVDAMDDAGYDVRLMQMPFCW